MDLETLQKQTEPILAHYTSLNPAAETALDNFVTAKTSFLIQGGKTLFFFISHNFPLFHRQAREICCATRRSFKNKSSQFIHVTDNTSPDSDSSFLIMTCDEFPAIRALAKEALLTTEANVSFTHSADDEKMYPNINAQTRNVRPTLPLVLTTFTPTSAPTVDTQQSTSA